MTKASIECPALLPHLDQVPDNGNVVIAAIVSIGTTITVIIVVTYNNNRNTRNN